MCDKGDPCIIPFLPLRGGGEVPKAEGVLLNHKSYLVRAPAGPPQSLRDSSLPAYARTGSARGSKLIEGVMRRR